MAVVYGDQPPYRDAAGNCRVCSAPPDAEHIKGCWVTATVEWLRQAVGFGEGIDPLTQWWLEVARTEAAAVVPKAIEYGATDLAEIGRQLVAAGVHGKTLLDDPGYLAELGVYFYVLGKLARWTDAVATGRMVSDDTLHDIGVYVRMVQRIRSAGSWPGIMLGHDGGAI